MKKFLSILSYSTYTLNGLLLMAVIFSTKISPQGWIQVGGRLHPMLLHLPIGFYVLFVLLILAGQQRKAFRKSGKMIIQITAFFIALTALAGILLSREGGYDEQLLNRHLILGTIMSMVTMLLSQFSGKYLQHRYYQIYSAIGLIVLILTGHFGAVLTHGENYIFEPVTPKAEIPKDSTIFAMAVRPVLQAKCGSCHNASKKKGDLILISREGILKGGENGAVLVANRAHESEIIKRVWLPLDHDDHMPPAGKAQLTDNEILLLRLWISAGANFETRYNLLNQDSLQNITNQIAAQYAERSSERKYPFRFIPEESISKLNTPFRTVKQISTNEPALSANFFLAQYYEPKSLAELSSVAENIIELNLAGMPIGDEAINDILTLNNLERLSLNNTKITDKTLERLVKLEKLTVLRLAGTAVTVNGMRLLTKSKSIKEVYGWNTKTSEKDWASLNQQSGNITWNTGYLPEGNEILKLTAPLLKNESFLLTKNQTIVLKHNLSGTQIRYTLDGSAPDSVSSKVYQKPIALETHSALKAVAIKNGWLKSSVVTYQFFVQGVAPESAKLLSTPDKDYKGNGSESLIDNILGDGENFRDGNWIGFRQSQMSASFVFSDQLPREITIVYLQSIGSYIMPPEEIEVWSGDNENRLTLLKRVKPAQPKEYLPNGLGAISISIEKPSKWLKLNINHVAKLPPWHSGKGEKGWVMVSEIIFR
jgi:uncharacterized membrane protein